MKSKLFPIVFALTLFAGTASNAADGPTFLKMGKTYRLVIGSDEGVASHGLAKILEDVGGGWFFVEYSTLEFRNGGNELVPRRMWLNFAHVTAASEVTAETAETPKERIPSSKP